MSNPQLTKLNTALKKHYKDIDSTAILTKYQFCEDYLNDYTSEQIALDISLMENLTTDSEYALSMHSNEDDFDMWQIKLIKLNDQVSLSRGLPIIENFGVKLIDEHPYVSSTRDGSMVHVCDFGVQVPHEFANKINDIEFAKKLTTAMVSVFNRQTENDILNSLVLYSDLSAREIVLLRAVTQYLVQTALPYSRQYMAECLGRYPTITQKLFAFFKAKFHLTENNAKEAALIHEQINDALKTVNSLDEDRILNAYATVIDAMIRTNYYQVNENGEDKEYVSFKIESGKVLFLPKPLPLYEIFVYSMYFEGVHLRGGKVARGGFRWSDRREDFRTEVLGLVKAQIVKNAVIVPTGSKGGFVCKKLPAASDRDAYIAEGVMCYQTFICGLLDITDNLVLGKVVPPANVVCYDDDDPYLVVAADKGTATFSDYANAISKKYNFWLGDSFASGGSDGYDHKKMGITARGAWEAAKRHFRHLNIDIQNQEFTVIGIGDMAGDVFGNGMLLSKHIKLIAAFNHQHIFLDPDPDPKSSFAERQRLFNLPRSSWADYDTTTISNGGGVYSRSLKTITLTNEVKKLLNVQAHTLQPNELINAILKAPADMLYNGGIGTYVKSELESHEAAKDRTNDPLRVNGNELRVKVVIEGGNLGVTQLGRVEFAKAGGAINNDAIDNSAGVDCSDHEVNIKILFADIMQDDKLSLEERNKILSEMTEDVAELVLRDNYLQTEVLRYAATRSKELFMVTVNFMERLEKTGVLDRKVEFLPNSHEIAERIRLGVGFTSPELSVLLAYAKLILNHAIVKTPLVEEQTFDTLLLNYFPGYLQKHYTKYIHRHYLKKEIVATQLSNLIINRMGITFATRFAYESKVDVAQVCLGFWAVYNIIDAESLFEQIEALDNKIAANIQVELLIYLKKALERTIRWLLRTVKTTEDLTSFVHTYGADVRKLLGSIMDIVTAVDNPRVMNIEQYLLNARVPTELAQRVARIGATPQLLDVVMIARETKSDVDIVANNYFYVGRTIRMDWLRINLTLLPENNKWEAISRSALLADAYALYSQFIKNAISAAGHKDKNFADTWIKNNPDKVLQLNTMFDELQSYKTVDLSMLSAVVRELQTILV